MGKWSAFLSEVSECQYPNGKKVYAPRHKRSGASPSIGRADEYARHTHDKAAEKENAMDHHESFHPLIRLAARRTGRIQALNSSAALFPNIFSCLL